MKPTDPIAQLVYWCGCQAATLEHMCGLKRTSKADAARQHTITFGMITTAKSLIAEVEVYDGTQLTRLYDELKRVIARADAAVAEGQTRGLCKE